MHSACRRQLNLRPHTRSKPSVNFGHRGTAAVCRRKGRRAAFLTAAASPQQESAAAAAAPDSSGPNNSSSRCPVLSSLPRPPPAATKWYNRMQQISHPSQWQADTLAGHSMVSLPAQMLLPAYYVVGDGEVAKQVLAGEGSITTQGVDRDMRFARLVGLQSLLAVQQPRHTFMRTLIAPAFTQTAVEALIPRMVSVISAYLETWAQSGQPVLAEPQLRSLTFDLICAVSESGFVDTGALHYLSLAV
eukprot:GHUV01025326.1.p1 GENE.GHUV01025326.1~~GHUV01025326.1.p1  ORF type:complete len:246 (+),score=49.13 GHUV01025326.1:61-798(+)